MLRRLIYLGFLIILFQVSNTSAQVNYLPYPPAEFFTKLAKTTIQPGDTGCCFELRNILTNSVMISPYLAVKLFREGKILIGDARTQGESKGGHIFGALLFPYNKIDFMRLKPISIPIALY